ncbi:putative trans-aconitate 3-methyltransferase [Clavispora lusitaniae]|uniref:Trans-aconitate 3-methyltransferase n=1 Tax=Clavispora lusitaniae TaxID=36911 RepID=A0AA91Q080_CLALS|nr:putative trans-aconitate 3-methyltransferase [Clavispora lusitaniae]
MTTFAKSAFDSVRYEAFRPHYPKSFYEILKKYCGRPKVSSTIDLGCGTGVASFPLLELSEKVVGLDLSPKMIETANQIKSDKLAQLGITDQSRIAFKVSAVEDLDEPAQSFDLITCAECIHWFKDFDSFFSAASNLLKPGGVLAYWYYADPVVVAFDGPYDQTRSKVAIADSASSIYRRFVYENPEFLGPHWEQPGRTVLKNFLVEVDKHIPYSKFENVKVNKYVPSTNGETKYAEDDLQISKQSINLQSFIQYISTYSSYHKYDENTGKGKEFLEKFIKAFEEELGWDREKTILDLEWYSGYTFMTRK